MQVFMKDFKNRPPDPGEIADRLAPIIIAVVLFLAGASESIVEWVMSCLR